VPIVPVVAIGGQETVLFAARGERAAQATGWAKLTRIKVLPVALAPPSGLTVLDLPPRLPIPAKIAVASREAISPIVTSRPPDSSSLVSNQQRGADHVGRNQKHPRH
jgi:hypothetical protein